jgi:hypothetical protein
MQPGRLVRLACSFAARAFELKSILDRADSDLSIYECFQAEAALQYATRRASSVQLAFV